MNVRALVVRLLAVIVVASGSSLGWAGSPAQAAEGDPVTVTGTVVDAITQAGIEAADVEAVGPSSHVATTGAGGNYTLDLEPGSYEFYADADGYESGYAEFEVTAETTTIPAIELEPPVDLSCTPDSVHQGLTNMGFEDDLSGWKLGHQTESIEAAGADDFTSPWEGSRMARLGHSQPSDGESQPEGPNIMCQDFVVTDPEETFSFNVFTYDYTGFDEFRFDLVVTDPATGETLAAYQQGAWGEGTELKTSGWRGVKLNLADRVGDTVRLTFRAGGTSDSLYAFWAYLDSADTLPPVIEPSTSDVETETGSVTTDPATGQVTVSMPFGDKSDVTMTVPASCVDPEATPTSVSLILDGTTFNGTPVGDGLFEVTIPAESIVSGQLSVQIECDGETTVVAPIGQIVLYDPSGIITDATTGEPVVGAEVSLYKVPDWEPQGAEGPYPADSCQTNLSKAADAPWNQPAPTDIGQLVNAASPEISPNVNPFVTNNVGYYGWDVAEGCWYVVVNADGYVSLTSPVVGVPTAVTDLDLTLQPVDPPAIANTTKPVITGKRVVGSVLTASPGTWDVPGVSFAYQWLRAGTPIAGATASTYKVAAADVTKSLAVRVTASKAGYADGVATSSPVGVPKAATKTLLSIVKRFKSTVRAVATVRIKAPAGLPRTGKVTIKAGTKIVGTGTAKGGKARVKLKRLRPGTYKLVARFAGNAKLKPSKSAKVRVKVIRP